MGRPRSIDDADFREAYEAAKRVGQNMQQFATSINMTVATAYIYAKRLKLPSLTTNRVRVSKDSLTFFKEFTGNATVESLADQYGVHPTSVRYHINRAIKLLWSRKNPKRPKLPKPKLAQVKVYHILAHKPDLAQRPNKIARLTNVSQRAVNDYLSQKGL